MKMLLNNIRSWDDFLNVILMAILMVVIYSTNGTRHLKMWYYKLRGIECFMYTDDPKFGIKRCMRK